LPALLRGGSPSAASSQAASTTTIDTNKTFQTIEDLGGAIAFWVGSITAHPFKQEIAADNDNSVRCSAFLSPDHLCPLSNLTTNCHKSVARRWRE